MLPMFRKSFWESDVSPTVSKAREAISRYCEQNGWSCSFPGEDEALIDGALYEVYRGYETGSRGNYGVKCRAK